jgi:hypothetical protein
MERVSDARGQALRSLAVRDVHDNQRAAFDYSATETDLEDLDDDSPQ